ncbi:MAG: transporter, partial [Muribaculaceae bacterium]|nr:transporter [Muribaculaceae bacterium]MDY4749880.1 transporter [Sodaliphilus sp.]
APLSLLAAIAVVSFVICVIQFSVGRNIGRFFGSTVESGQALGQKNTAFAIWVSSAYINPLAAVGPGCYIIWQNAINSLELYHHRKNPNK